MDLRPRREEIALSFMSRGDPWCDRDAPSCAWEHTGGAARLRSGQASWRKGHLSQELAEGKELAGALIRKSGSCGRD